MTWVPVPRLPCGELVAVSMSCGHIRVLRYGWRLPDSWEEVFCPACGEYRRVGNAGVIRA